MGVGQRFTLSGCYAKTLREAVMLMALLWPFVSAFVVIAFGRPTLERNHLWKCVTHATHNSAEICSHSNTGASSAFLVPSIYWQSV